MSVKRRNCRGATAPSEVARMLQLQRQEVKALTRALDQRSARWEEAGCILHTKAKELAAQV